MTTAKKRSYEHHKEFQRQRKAQESAEGRDIGGIPEVAKPKRRKACAKDLKKFLETYFPQKFSLGWSKDHLIVIEKIERAVLGGGLFAMALPRGSGKTTICERAALWAVIYGHRRFPALIGATEEAACGNLDEIKMEIECNDLLLEDFPEVCYPVRKLEGIANRCKGQTCNGERTRITWTDGEIVLPTVQGSKASGAVVKVRGILGRLRGMKAAVPTGESLRPDLVLIDDPQTDESAASPEQNRKRLRILLGTVLGLAGPGVKISGVMPCTVIRNGDMADEILNADKHPEWHGERRRLLQSFPENMELWNKYSEIWADSLRNNGSIKDATEFYKDHREEMDKGGVVAWEARHEPDELSGLQYAMNLFIRDKETFYAEYQNDPIPDDNNADNKISVENVWQRMNRRKRGEVPEEAEHITMYIDVQGTLLFWVIMAFADNFSGWVIDYGAFPDQKRRYFTLRDANPTFRQLYQKAGLEGAIYAALMDLTNEYLPRSWIRDDGTEMYIDKCTIDSSWGKSTSTVYKFCKESPFSRILLPAKGKGITAAQKPFTEYRKEIGTKLGYNWRIWKVRKTSGVESVRLFEYDTNFWKSFYRERLLTQQGDNGSLTVFGNDEELHRNFAEHLSSEVSTETFGNGRRVDVWTLLPGRENHWLDGVVGCMATASTLGCDIDLEVFRKALPKTKDFRNPNIVEKKKKVVPSRIVPGKRIIPKK